MRSTSASSSHVALSPGGYAHTLVTPKPFPLGSEEPPTPPSPGCSIPFMVFLAAPKMAMNMAWAAQWAAFGPLLETLMPSWSVQLVQIIGPLTGLFVAPTIGVLSDACTSSYGRRRPFILFGAVASSICWLVMSYARELGVAMGDHGPHQLWTATWTVLCYVWMDITVNMTQVPVSLILADFAGERQVTAASIGQAFSIAGSFCISGYILLFGPAHASIHPFMWMLVAVMLGTALPVCLWATEKPYVAHNPVSRCKQLQNAFGSVYTGLRNLPRVLVSFCVCFLLIQYGYTAYNGAKGQFFGLRVYHGDAEGANTCEPSACSDAQKAFNKGVQVAGGITDTIFNGVGLVYLAVLPWLVRKCGAKIVFTWAILPQALLIAMAFSSIVQLNVAIVVLCAVTQNTIFAMQIPVILHVVGHGPENQLGLFAGAFNSANCAGQLINFLLATLLVQTSMGHALPVLVGGVLSFLALVIAQLTFHIDMKSL